MSVFVALMVTLGGLAPVAARQESATNLTLVQALSCFHRLGGERRLKVTVPVRVRMIEGEVPGTSGGLNGRRPYQVFIEHTDTQAELRTFALVQGGIEVLAEYYDLRRRGRGKAWVVEDGNGGIGTFRAVARFVNRTLSRQPSMTISKESELPEGVSCRTNE